MIRKILKADNSFIIALPKEISDALELDEDSEVTIEFDEAHQQIIIAPLKTALDDVDLVFAKQVAEFIDAYRPALEALAQ